VTLAELLEVSPGNRWGLTKRAELEIFCDRLESARETYRGLVEVTPSANVLRNLAWIDFLLGRYDPAAEAGRRALALEPGHPRARLNLALAEDARGGAEEAARLYRDLAAEAGAGEGDPTPEVIRAQALVRLGRHLDAVRALREVLVRRPELDPQDHYMAAQVFALAGERLSALDAAERALDGGVGARWFGMPAFDSLAGDPELEALLSRYRARCS
jgi:tetratricopeptide (TPR) repeat protein